MLSDARFSGFGHFFDSTWATLIVVKHVVVVALVGVGVYLDLLVVPGIEGPVDEAARAAAVGRLARGAAAMVILGAIVLLLTAGAQALGRAAP
jgi:putative copper export protein